MSIEAAWMLTNGRLVDGLGEHSVPDHAVLVDDARIAWVGPIDQAPSGVRTIDVGGRTVMPGLINSHVHLANDGHGDLAAQVAADSTVTATLRAFLSAQVALGSGVTTVKDCGARDNIAIDLGRAVESGLVPGPRVRAAGRVITITGGHGHFMGVEADGVDSVRAAVRGQIKAGAHFIKAMATGGVLTRGVHPTQTTLLRQELEAIVEEAHNAGKRVSAHAIGRGGIENALRAGVDTIEHGFHLDEELFELAIEKGTFLVPTLLAVHSIVAHGTSQGSPTWVVDKARSELERSRSMFREAVEAGVRIAAGTDAGTPFNPHDALADELALMVDIGLSPMRVLLAATRDAAVNADVLHETGTIEVGKSADVLVVDGDPTTDITALRRVVLVATSGRIHRDELGSVPG